MEKILITGGTGLIGKNLIPVLQKNGFEVVLLVRKAPANSTIKYHLWNPDQNELDESVFDGVDHILHLAGENIGAKRWTKSRKKKLYDSRIKSANLLFEKSKNANIKTFITASGVNFYGTITSDHIFTENDQPGSDFLSQLTLDWEKSADQFSNRGTRIVKLRTGVVLSEKGGALEKILIPFKWNVGSELGDGKQYMPWIHLNDLMQIYVNAVTDKNMNGAYNAVAPTHITNSELTSLIAKNLGKKLWAPRVPAFVIRLLFGEMGNLVLKGSRVSSEKLINQGYTFQSPKLEETITNLISVKK